MNHMPKATFSIEPTADDRLLGTPEVLGRRARPFKQQSVIETAKHLFFANGFSATSMEAVAKKAGIGKATLYEMFPNKVELLRAVINIELDSRSDVLHLVAVEPGEIRPVLVKFAQSLIDLLLSPENISMYRIISAEMPQHPEFGKLFYSNGPARVIGYLSQYFSRLMEEGRLHYGNPTLMASQFIGIVRANMQTRVMFGVDDDALIKERTMIIESGVDAFMRAYAKTRIGTHP